MLLAPEARHMQDNVIVINERFKIYKDSRSADIGKRHVEFTTDEFRALVFLASHKDRSWTKSVFRGRAYSGDPSITDDKIYQNIMSLKGKLGQYKQHIKIFREGYCFVK